MADCELLRACLFYNKRMPVEDTLWSHFVKLYCKAKYTKCGRYIVATALGAARVPSDLYPNMDITANEIIKGEKH